MKLLEEAFTPPPNYEEAETWLTNNQFIGKNALHEDGYPGRAVYAFEIPKTFKNLPEKYIQAIDKICALIKNDETLSKEKREYAINKWRIPKEGEPLPLKERRRKPALFLFSTNKFQSSFLTSN